MVYQSCTITFFIVWVRGHSQKVNHPDIWERERGLQPVTHAAAVSRMSERQRAGVYQQPSYLTAYMLTFTPRHVCTGSDQL